MPTEHTSKALNVKESKMNPYVKSTIIHSLLSLYHKGLSLSSPANLLMHLESLTLQIICNESAVVGVHVIRCKKYLFYNAGTYIKMNTEWETNRCIVNEIVTNVEIIEYNFNVILSTLLYNIFACIWSPGSSGLHKLHTNYLISN